jgi:hypothetical protein
MSATTLLETVAVFDTAANFQDAIDELMSSGFDRADLSFAAAEKPSKKSLVTHTGQLPSLRMIQLFPALSARCPSTSAPLPQLASSSVTAVHIGGGNRWGPPRRHGWRPDRIPFR